MSMTTSEDTGFAHSAAKGSYMCTIVAAVLFEIGKRVGHPFLFAFIGMLIIGVGLLLGVIALFGIPKYGTTGILIPALMGITSNGLLVFIAVTSFMAGRAKAQRARAAWEVPPAIISAQPSGNTARSFLLLGPSNFTPPTTQFTPPSAG